MSKNYSEFRVQDPRTKFVEHYYANQY